MDDQPAAFQQPKKRYDLADHFLVCSKLGRYLTVADGSRFVITDDLRSEKMLHEAAAVAAIYSKDYLVAEAALLPLGGRMDKMPTATRDKYERLFDLIAEESLCDTVRGSAKALVEARFREAEIRALDSQLRDKLSPARVRYRAFLGVVKKMIDGKIDGEPFLEEFRDFTRVVAGKLDFGIYSFCVDHIFRNLRIPEEVKQLLVLEILRYPPLVRRELLSNILAYPGQTNEVIEFVKSIISRELGERTSIEINLLEGLKLNRFTMQDINEMAAGAT